MCSGAPERSSVGRAIDCSVYILISVYSEINWSPVRFWSLGISFCFMHNRTIAPSARTRTIHTCSPHHTTAPHFPTHSTHTHNTHNPHNPLTRPVCCVLLRHHPHTHTHVLVQPGGSAGRRVCARVCVCVWRVAHPLKVGLGSPARQDAVCGWCEWWCGVCVRWRSGVSGESTCVVRVCVVGGCAWHVVWCVSV